MTGPDRCRALVVDDDRDVLRALGQWLELSGFSVVTAESTDAASAQLDEELPDVLLLDVRMPGRDGMSYLRDVRASRPDLPVVLLTGHGDVPMAVEAVKAGAFDFLTKPPDPERLATVLRNGAEQHRLRRRIQALQDQEEQPQATLGLVGRSQAMEQLRARIRALAPLPASVVVIGETGTGKELVARALHEAGSRRGRPFVAINCAAIPSEMIESELFGHEAGAFTGARTARIGKFEHASGGTIFLDEVEAMPLSAQAKVLRVLQERVVERLGGNRLIPVEIRVVSATKVDLREAAGQGTFRPDLIFRLAGAEIAVPPVRARGDDILQLFTHFAQAAAVGLGRDLPSLSTADAQAILAYSWPGNVRELRSVAERWGWGLDLDITHGGATGLKQRDTENVEISLPEKMDDYERMIIRDALSRSAGSIAGALKLLKIPRRTLNEKMNRLGIKKN